MQEVWENVWLGCYSSRASASSFQQILASKYLSIYICLSVYLPTYPDIYLHVDIYLPTYLLTYLHLAWTSKK